jgi:citrate lyase subunit beta/citryl-CoA lyase
MSLPPFRSYLYVPGSEERMIAKALDSEADAVVLDLEDAVAPGRKAEARMMTSEVLQSATARPVFVRINALDTEIAREDVEAICTPHLAGIRVPKAESADALRRLARELDRRGCPAGIQCLIESALGVELAFDLARACDRIVGLGIGEADLKADLGVREEGGLAYARSRVVVAARAAKLPAPVQSVYANVRDPEGLRESTEAGKRLGFVGRSAIHPSQVGTINEVFTPTEEEIAEARKLVERLEDATSAGQGTLVLEDGRFVDLAVAESARVTLALARSTGKGG